MQQSSNNFGGLSKGPGHAVSAALPAAGPVSASPVAPAFREWPPRQSGERIRTVASISGQSRAACKQGHSSLSACCPDILYLVGAREGGRREAHKQCRAFACRTGHWRASVAAVLHRVDDF